MSLKAVDIDPFFLAGIYRQPIIERGMEISGSPRSDVQAVPFLGNNSQKILLLIHNETAAYLDEPVFELLSNLLNACQLTMGNVALVNTAHLAETTIDGLRRQFAPHKVLIFGNALPALSSGKPGNIPWKEEGCDFLFTDSLDAMQDNPELKMPFWKALKPFFSLSAKK